ncbi:unnamed protein product [Adineta steineri]|uniref:Uncharacterized protein n=1 Tax=Adineta steineri TaxID=433720 RepID=A0A814MGU4_9BILA|nr:unnamed protein product [Adineta steineri]
MNDDNNNLTIDSSSPSSLTIPIVEQNEKLLSSMSTNIPITSSEINDKAVTPPPEDNEENVNNNNSYKPSFDDDNDKLSPLTPQSQSTQTIISTILDDIIAQIELNNNNNNDDNDNNNDNNDNNELNSLPVIEDDQMDVDDDEDDDDDNEEGEGEEEEEHEYTEKNSSIKLHKTEKERSTTRTHSSKTDLKPTTRTLRSHARGKRTSSTLIQTSSTTNNNVRRVSSRRRALDKKILLAANEKEKKRRSISERSKKDKDNPTTNDDNHTSSNSDDQTLESTNVDKTSNTTTANPNDEVSSCSSIGAGDESSTSSSTTNVKQSNTATDIDSLPPNKRRLRERNVGISNTSIPSLTTDASTNSNSTSATDNSSGETAPTREIPINSIKQFLEIRQQIDKRHETMLKDFVTPKVPKDFSETTMAKKNYLIAPSFSSHSITTPSSIGIKRLLAPNDLDLHLAEVFTKQEDERYKMKIRHQVERDKLILSHEQEVLRLYGNATRSSVNQDIPFSYCSLLKDNEVYNNPSIQLPEKLLNNDYTNTELGKRGKNRWNGRLFIKWLEDSNLKYKRLSCELNERQQLEVNTLHSMQRMVWCKHLPKDAASSSSTRPSHLLSVRYLPKVEINTNFWTNWETSPF